MENSKAPRNPEDIYPLLAGYLQSKETAPHVPRQLSRLWLRGEAAVGDVSERKPVLSSNQRHVV